MNTLIEIYNLTFNGAQHAQLPYIENREVTRLPPVVAQTLSPAITQQLPPVHIATIPRPSPAIAFKPTPPAPIQNQVIQVAEQRRIPQPAPIQNQVIQVAEPRVMPSPVPIQKEVSPVFEQRMEVRKNTFVEQLLE